MAFKRDREPTARRGGPPRYRYWGKFNEGDIATDRQQATSVAAAQLSSNPSTGFSLYYSERVVYRFARAAASCVARGVSSWSLGDALSHSSVVVYSRQSRRLRSIRAAAASSKSADSSTACLAVRPGLTSESRS